MSKRKQLRLVCRWNRDLARENKCLRDQLSRRDERIAELEETVASLGVQLGASEVLLGAAMDDAKSKR